MVNDYGFGDEKPTSRYQSCVRERIGDLSLVQTSKSVKRSRFVGFDLVVAAQPHVESNPPAARYCLLIAIKPR